jgi:cobalt-zinc-cadmium efflux system outer membrane protein
MRNAVGAAMLLLMAHATAVLGQAVPATMTDTAGTPLAALLTRARESNPTLRAARERVEAARARVTPAGTLPDPMLGIGVMNLPIDGAGYSEMTMNAVMLGQMLPFPGKLTLQRVIAEHQQSAVEARLEGARLDVERDVRGAYYELAFLDRALEVVERNQRLLVTFVGVTEARYGVGSGGQEEVLRAHVETSALADEAVTLTEQRRASLARLNALLDRPSDAPVEAPRVPERIVLAAVAPSASTSRFVSAALGARAANSPLPTLTTLQDHAIRNSPEVRAHEAEIAAQAARLELARRAHLPDFDISLQYGQRPDRSDMVSVGVSVPLPLRRASRQGSQVTESRAELSALEAEHHAHVNTVRARVAEAYSEAEKTRAQLALFVQSILPQGQAALESAIAGFQVGRAEFLTLLDNQGTLYRYESAYHRALTDFATAIAALDRLVGEEVLP